VRAHVVPSGRAVRGKGAPIPAPLRLV
jgi:hypothetical protein